MVTYCTESCPRKEAEVKGKFRIEVWEGNQIVFQVLEMDERFRREREEHIFTASNGIRVKSYSHSAIYSRKEIKEVYLRGSETGMDFLVTSATVASPERETARLKTALKEWAEKWKGWGEDSGKEGNILTV